MDLSNLFQQYGDLIAKTPNKITIVGCGQVGMACCFSLIMQKIPSEIVLIDIPQCATKMEGEEMDLKHGMAFFPGCSISASTDYSTTANSRICIITAGARQIAGESRVDLVGRNVAIFKQIVPNLVRYSPDCILLVVSNPVDILTYVTWKLSGLAKSRVIGSGTSLDSSRLRVMLSEHFKVSPFNIHVSIIGEHGDSSVPVWSTTSICGVLLSDLEMTQDERNKIYSLHGDVVKSAYEIIQRKGYTSWAIGVCVAAICRSIVSDLNIVIPVSVHFNIYPEINSGAFLSMPCVIGAGGIIKVVKLNLSNEEMTILKKSASLMEQVIESISPAL